MRNAPAVYIPTEPEGNGVTLPTLLSLLAHGIVLGLLLYTYQPPELEIASIETTMVTPGELAAMQEQILANRAAQAAGTSSSNESSETALEPTNVDDISRPLQENNPSQSQDSAVFSRSNQPADSSLMISQEHRQRLLEQNQEYERNIARLAAELDDSIAADNDQVTEAKQRELDEEREKLKSFQQVQNNPPLIKKPSRGDRNIEITAGSSGASESMSLSDGESVVASNSTSTGSPSRSTGDFKNEIAEKVQQYLDAPQNTQGTIARVLLKLDARGNVNSAEASGANPEVNAAAERAAYAASPLPIDLSNPSAFRELAINVKVK